MALFPVRQYPRWRLTAILEQPPSWNDGAVARNPCVIWAFLYVLQGSDNRQMSMATWKAIAAVFVIFSGRSVVRQRHISMPALVTKYSIMNPSNIIESPAIVCWVSSARQPFNAGLMPSYTLWIQPGRLFFQQSRNRRLVGRWYKPWSRIRIFINFEKFRNSWILLNFNNVHWLFWYLVGLL